MRPYKAQGAYPAYAAVVGSLVLYQRRVQIFLRVKRVWNDKIQVNFILISTELP